jgi:hypothetical protein
MTGASKIAHYTMDNDLKLKAADVKLRFSTEDEFDRIADPERPERMVNPHVDTAA